MNLDLAEMDKGDFSKYSEFCSTSSGGKVIFATDDFFSPCEVMLSDAEPIFVADKYTEIGKWMDGWETRRKRIPGHDWCLLQLATKCVIRGILVDTAYFTGNYAPKFSIQASYLPAVEQNLIPQRYPRMGEACSESDLKKINKLKSDEWEVIVLRTALRPGYEGTRHNYFQVVNDNSWTHIRVNIYPDGGIARLRVFGEAKPESPIRGQLVDLAALLNGAKCLAYSNAHYGHPKNMIKPNKSTTMADGWETARRLDRPEILEANEDGTLKVPGEEWAVFKLAFPGTIEEICIDTAHFKGNFPDSVKVDGVDTDVCWKSDTETSWSSILKTSKLSAHKEHWFKCKSSRLSLIKITMVPDGGISRIRVYGYPEC